MLLKGRYEVLKDLSATTRLARHVRTGEELIVKEIVVKELSSWGPLQQFEEEVQILSSVHHPAVPELVDSFVLDEESPDPRYFLVRKLVGGRPLSELIEKRLSSTELHSLARALLETLAELHELSPPLLHGSLEPRKVLRTDREALVFLGFGLAARPSWQEDESPSGYQAPERETEPATAASDLFSLGAMLFQLATGRAPELLTHSAGRPELEGALDPRIARLLDRTLRIAPQERPASAAAALKLMSETTALALPEETALAFPRKPLRATAAVAGISALLELVLVFASPTAAAVLVAPLLAALYLSYRVERRIQGEARSDDPE